MFKITQINLKFTIRKTLNLGTQCFYRPMNARLLARMTLLRGKGLKLLDKSFNPIVVPDWIIRIDGCKEV